MTLRVQFMNWQCWFCPYLLELRKSDLEVTARHLNEVEAVQHVTLSVTCLTVASLFAGTTAGTLPKCGNGGVSDAVTSELGDRQSSHPVKTLLQYYGKSLEALPGVAYSGFRDNRSTLNTKTGFKKKMPATLANTFLFILRGSALQDLRCGGRFRLCLVAVNFCLQQWKNY